MSTVTHDPRRLSTEELDVDIALARLRVVEHTRCGRRPNGDMQCQFGRDAVAEQDELLEVRHARG